MKLEESKLIILKKFIYLIILFYINFLIIIVIINFNLCLNLNYFNLTNININNLNFSVLLRFSTIIFSIIVLTVTLIVCLFREIYIEWYNNKKYLFFISSFFISIIILSFRSRPIILIISWDFLGITSIFLIIFYPNITSINNSLWTIFFNRIGDLSILSIICILQLDSNFYFWLSKRNTVITLSVICIFTKRAQFPISTWLPLAISAPTPISAIVHSSTLVTAGILIIEKILNLLEQTYLIKLIFISRAFRFLCGGIIACSESDSKKIIAFSTIRQISIIIILLRFNIKILRLLHIFFHALFKRILFISSGKIFFIYSIDQNKFNFSSKNLNKYISIIIILTIYRITGILFSLSFYTKDLSIEINFSLTGEVELLILIITGRFLTIKYCCEISKSLTNWPIKKYYFYKKKSRLIFIICISISILIFLIIYMVEIERSANWIEILIINFIIITISIIKFKPSTFKIYKLTKNTIFFRLIQLILIKFYTKIILTILITDNFFLKKSQLTIRNYKIITNSNNYKYIISNLNKTKILNLIILPLLINKIIITN